MKDIITYSQAGQDIFVRLITNFQNNGYFLDIGCQHTKCLNNTYILEKELHWSGIMIDMDISRIEQCYKDRSMNTKKMAADLTKRSLREILIEEKSPNLIDYISLDIDWATEYVLDNFPFDQYRFKIMTFEHDTYTSGQKLREKSRQILTTQGYTILCSNVRNAGNPFEDWYVDAKYFDSKIIEEFRFSDVDYQDIFKHKNLNIIKGEF